MIKSLLLLLLLCAFTRHQNITPYYILPVETTQNAITSYSFLFGTDTAISTNALVRITFPFEFDARFLPKINRVRYSTNTSALINATFIVNQNIILIQVNQIQIGNITIVIDNVLNPTGFQQSSSFVIETLFQNVVVTSNNQFGSTIFSSTPVTTSNGQVNNYENVFIEQGSSWTFTFSLSTTYSSNSSIRFVFPQGFTSNKVQCNVSGVIDPNSATRTFPSLNVYDCLNLQQQLSGSMTVILSGIVNPNYKMTAGGFQIHILQPNNLVTLQKISPSSTVNIQAKPLNTTVQIPNRYRNNSVTYTFQINFDTDLMEGDYFVMQITGLWTFLANRTSIVSGVNSNLKRTPTWTARVNTTTSISTITLTNFTSILKTTQFTFYLPLITPLAANTYAMTVSAFRKNGNLAQVYTQNVIINKTTGYIRQMKLHPMQRAIKLPVGQTGPLEIVLFLRNNLPQTNVLTWGKIYIEITPNIPAPILSLNGVPKCYFYKDIPAVNCTFDSSNSSKTVVTVFTPKDFNFQESEVPLTITTEGYLQPQNQGITIDTLVKRYFFEIQFYSHLSPSTPLEVIFDEWIPDSIPLNTMTCQTTTTNQRQYDHIKCSFVTPSQVLNSGGHIHFFRFQFGTYTPYNNPYYPYDYMMGWPLAGNTITPDYPCLVYGTNVSAVPYGRCDFVTYQSGPYKSQQTSTSFSYLTVYGLDTIPGGSTITIEIPNVYRQNNAYSTILNFNILEDTPGYTSPIVYLYYQTIDTGYNSYYSTSSDPYTLISPSITLSNSVVNKVTSIQLNNINLGTSGITQVILQVDQTAFPNIGRGQGIACGTHTCSKFDKPIQYFILYPTSTLGSTATLIFPNIVNPSSAGNYLFKMRTYKSGQTYLKVQFYVTITVDTITTRSYKFSPTFESISTLYPNSDHLYTISWTTVNPIASGSGGSYITVNINNVFSLSSAYCNLVTSASAYDERGIQCSLSAGGSQITLYNMADVPIGSTFALTVQLKSTLTTSTVSPTVTITTYESNNNPIDTAVNVPFITTPLTNTNLTVFSLFSVPTSYTSTQSISAGYFGHLLINYQPYNSTTVINGTTIIITMPTGFYPSGNALSLPLQCRINNVRFLCTYALSPSFTITISKTNSSFTTGVNIINITTNYLNKNGIQFPANQGRYLITLEVQNRTAATEYIQKVEQYVDILPPPIGYFNVSWAVKDYGTANIFTVEFKNGPTVIPSYNDATNAGRIYIGFPVVDANNNPVFTNDLGYGLAEGSVLPCYFDTGFNFVTATASKALTCKLRLSLTNNYMSYIQIINFAAIPAGGVLRVFIAKVTNPSSQQVDINFVLRVNTVTLSTMQESKVYESNYNMFIDMVPFISNPKTQTNSSSIMFQAGSVVGMTNRYINITPYTTTGGFSNGDWFIVNMDSQFPFSGTVFNCLSPFYQYCIVYPTINWLAVKVGNGTILPLQVVVSQLPISISRVDTTYTAYTFLSGRWKQTITYTVTAASRWIQIRGQVKGFSIQVLGSQNKINVGQKNVEVLVSFNVSNPVPIGGTIQIQFPNNASTVPAIKTHCRSAVTLGSSLNGYNTGKPSVNIQGEVGCTVQNTYSWIITGFDYLPAGSQVKIFGMIDLPTVATNSLGNGYICTYSNQDSSNTFANARTIDYLSTNFPMSVSNLTWNLDTTLSMYSTAPLRTGHVGEFKFILNLHSLFYAYTSGGYIDLILWYRNVMYSVTSGVGGFNGPSSNLVCTIFNPQTGYKYGCYASNTATPGAYTSYRIQTYQNLPASTNLEITLTTQNGNAVEGINFPTTIGTYKVETEIQFYTSNSFNRNAATYIDVYGPDFNALSFNSTITIPGQNNFILVIFTPCTTIATDTQLIIEIPTVSIDGAPLFPADLGMGYKDYDNLVFDMFESSIASMSCKVYTGDASNNQPVKIICSSFSSSLSTSTVIKFGFWVVNPQSQVALSIPIQVYTYQPYQILKTCWSLVEAGIRILPITVTPINDIGNFYFPANTPREMTNVNFGLTARNTKAMVTGDWYILKFNFDLRNSGVFSSSYNVGLSSSGDLIFLRNTQTILIRIGTNSLSIVASGSTSVNLQISNFYTPPIQLTVNQSTILAYAVYNVIDACEKIIYTDKFPSLPPQQPSNPSWGIYILNSNNLRGQKEDYQFIFQMSSNGGSSTQLVKMISVQFPTTGNNDFKFSGVECFQNSNSQIEISSCYMNPTTKTIWLTPLVKSSYTNNKILDFETGGLSITNPTLTTSVNINLWTIRYYTWPDGTAAPILAANSDDYCFMKQTSTNLPSSTLSYSGPSYSPHNYFKVQYQNYVNEFEPADTSIGTNLAKTPFFFKIYSPTNFNSPGTGNFHTISLTFSSYYSVPTLNQNSNDLYYYVPSCQLNGFNILGCSISGGTITMRFQQIITINQEISVRFSIINPYNLADQGFSLINTNSPTITLPITITPYGGTTYYIEPQPFHSFYRTSTVPYPSMGISLVTANWGTLVLGEINYVEFSITFSRDDINGLVLQIPVVEIDGNIAYSNPTLLGLPSGSKYPCSVGVDVDVFCYYETGSSTGYGRPTRIFVTSFDMPVSRILSFRILLTNPDNSDVYSSFTFKAYGGTKTPPKLMGEELMGIYDLINPYKIYPKSIYLSTGTCTMQTNNPLWSVNTYYDFYVSDQNLLSGNYVILVWPLVHSTYGQFGDFVADTSTIYDYFIITNSNNQKLAYIILKLTSNYIPSASSFFRFGYIRQKHHLYNSYTLYLLRKPASIIYTCNVNNTWLLASRSENYFGTFTVDKVDVRDKTSGYSSWHYASINTGTAYNLALSPADPSTMVVVVKFDYGKTYSTLGSSCVIEAGVWGNDPLNPVTCTTEPGNNRIVIQNVYRFSGSKLKFYYIGTMASSQSNFDVTVSAFADVNAFNDGNWPIYYSSTDSNYNLIGMLYNSNTGYAAKTASEVTDLGNAYPANNYANIFGSGSVQRGGYTAITYVSSTQIRVTVYRDYNQDFSNVYRMGFRFYTQRLSPSGCQSVSITSNRYSSGYWMTPSCSTGDRYFHAIYSYYSDGNNAWNWGNNWPYWYGGDYYSFTFTFSSVGGDSSNNANYLFVTATILYETSVYHVQDSGKCGWCITGSACCTYGSWACSTCWNSCTSYCYDSWYDNWYPCGSYNCNSYCCNCGNCVACSCRWIYGWNFFFLTGTGGTPYTAPSTNLVNGGASIFLVSNQYGTETQFSFTLNSLSTNLGPSYNNELIIRFTGNNVFPSNNPFPYTTTSESAAPIDCLCVVGASISITAGTSYTAATCTRYILSNLQPSISVRMDAATGQTMMCFFPGFRVPTNGYGGTMYANFYLEPMNHFKISIPDNYWQPYQVTGVSYSLTTQSTISGFNTVTYDPTWNLGGSVRQSVANYQLYIGSPYNLLYPTLYMSTYSPKPSQSTCNNANYKVCRAYTTFYSRRYFWVIQSNNSISYMNLQDTLSFPQSKEYSSSYYSAWIGWACSSNYYYHTWSGNFNQGYLSEAAPTINYKTAIFGSNLGGTPTSLTISVNLNGYTLYNMGRTNGPFQGSFMQLVLGSFTSINGCSAFQSDYPLYLTNTLYCVVSSSTTVYIYSRSDITFTGYVYITINTGSVPNSCSYNFYLYDRYVTSTNYGRAIVSSNSFSRSTGYSLLQSTSIKWRRQAYKQLRTDASPIRFTVNTNFQYASNYSVASNSEQSSSGALLVQVPFSIENTNYYCWVKQFLPSRYDLYNLYPISCAYSTTNTVLIKSIPNHIRTPNYYYEFSIYKNTNGSSMLLTTPSTSIYIMKIMTRTGYTSGTILFLDSIPMDKYQSVYPISLNSIYILTRQAAAFNSLYVSFTVSFTTAVFQYLEFEFNNLDLVYFGITNGGEIPCYLSSNFTTISGKTYAPRCFGYAHGLNKTSPLVIRVLNFGAVASGTIFKIAFDNFNNPPIQQLFFVPINLRIQLRDRYYKNGYTSYFPNIYYSDSTNIAVPTNLGGSIGWTSSARGASNLHYMNLNWPYTSNSADVSQKLFVRVLGGITCCQSFNNLNLQDSQGATYNILWTNTKANITVYSTPSKNSGTNTNLTLRNVNNPQPVNMATYNENPIVNFAYYYSYKTQFVTQLNQIQYSTYTMLSDFVVDNNPSSPIDSPRSFSSHLNYPLTYDIYINPSYSSYTGRNLSYIVIFFTSGIKSIEQAYFRYSISPNYFNTLASPKFGLSGGQWFINITGVSDSIISSTYLWYVRVRLYASSTSFGYTASTYNFNGQLEYQSSGSRSVSSDGWTSSSNNNAPTTWALADQRYTKGYFELKRKYLYAVTSSTTNKLMFKFITPYNISETQTFSLISSSTTTFVSTGTTGIYCILQPTSTYRSVYGVGLYAPCTYSAGIYTIQVPVGGLSASKEYLLTISDRKRLTSTFNMPSTPQRVELSLIYNSILNLQYGDVYTLDFSGFMNAYNVDHSTLMSDNYDMLGISLTPYITLPASTTSAPVTESVVRLEIESTYYDSCLGLSTLFASDGMTFYNGIYYSHYASPAVLNSNTRILCGQFVQAQNYAPIILSITDYGQMLANNAYYFRFPLTLLPSGTKVPLTYQIKLVYYTSNNHYPIVYNTFKYENKQSSSPGSNSYQWATISPLYNYVQQTMSLSFSYSSLAISNGQQTLVKFKNNNIKALTSLNTLTTLSNTHYNYQYYPNINVCSFIKNSGVASYGFSLGTYPTSIDQQSFQISWVYTYSGTGYFYYGYFGAGYSYSLNTINIANLWSSSSFSKISGLVTTYSWNLYTISFSSSTLSFPQQSYMIITISSPLIILDEYCYGTTGFVQGVNTNSNFVCKRYSANQIKISGYSLISAGAALSLSLYLQIANNARNTTYTPYANIIVYSSAQKVIIDADTASYSLYFLQNGAPTLGLNGKMNMPYTAGTSYPLYITFQLTTYTLVNGDYLQIDFGTWVVDPATSGAQIFKYQIGSNIYWVPASATLVSGNIYQIPVYSNYTISAGTSITLWIDTVSPTNYQGVITSNINWNIFKIYAYKSGVLREQNIQKIWVQPYGHQSLTVNSALNYVGASSLYEFSVTPNVSAAVGDTILIEFTTADSYYSNLYPTNLGASIPSGLAGKLDCNQLYNTRVISSTFITCAVYAGSTSTTPSTPAVISIPIKKAISANTNIQFNIINIQNPSQSGVPIGITLKLATPCYFSDTNNLCAYYKSTTYLSFNTAVGVPGYVYTGTHSFNPNIISAKNTVHTISASYSLAVGDFIKVKYYPQVPIPATCQISSGNGYCYSYPSINTIVIKATVAINSPYIFTLTGMTNPHQYYYPSNPLDTQIWRSGTINYRIYTSFATGIIYNDPTTNNPLSISFTPTLTPNYQLKYGFSNIAIISLSYLLQNAQIKQIFLQAPSEITIDTNYCNATMETLSTQAKPYPFRFICTPESTTGVRINLQSDFPTWNSAYINRKIIVYLRYTILNTQVGNSNFWYAYTYTDPTTRNTNVQVSRGQGNFAILEYLVPHLYVINFPTESFNQRTCSIGEKCMFYGYLYPTTLQSDLIITKMTFLVPKQFGYSNLQTYDSCTLQSTTTTKYTFGCAANRNNSQITMAYNPPTYNQLYNLINLDSSSASQLFTAPMYPGNHYQMQVNLWTSGGALVESQYINLTTVYGNYLSVPQIIFSIPMDASAYGIFDFQFTLGTSDILPSYVNSASNAVTSAIELIFSNSFAFDLGTGLSAGSQIPCLPVSGLTFNTMGKLTCKIYPSTSSITYPTVIITGYDRIYASSVVRFRLANLKTLAAGITDYIKLGASLTYFTYGGTKGYIYEPVSFVVGPTTAPITPNTITFTVNEIGTNFVGQLSNYTLSGSLGAGFSSITTSDYFMVQFPSNIFEGRFNQNAKALCSLASSNLCYVFGLSNQIYFSPSSTVSASSFTFTINNILNAAYQIVYINQTIKLYTIVNNKVNAYGIASYTKFTKPSLNISGIITSITSIYGGDSGINYNFEFVLNSYLPEGGKISIVFPSIYLSLKQVNSQCSLRSDSQALLGNQAYCQIINSYQLVIVPNGVLLSASQTYYLTVTNITNPNVDLSKTKFTISTYYTGNVYWPLVISSSTFDSPILSLITVKQCQIQVSLSVYNPFLPSKYQINLICPTTIKQSSQLKLYLSWNPSVGNGTCSGDQTTLYSTQCNIMTEYNLTTKLTFLSIYLRSITATKLVSITGTIPNGNQGTYQINGAINFNGFVYLTGTSNDFYIASSAGTATTTVIATSNSVVSNGQAITLKNANYPLNRQMSAIFTFGITNPQLVVSTLQIDLPSSIIASKNGIKCSCQPWNNNDNYFNLMLQQGTNVVDCSMTGQSISISNLTKPLASLSSDAFLYIVINGLINPSTSNPGFNFTFAFINTSSSVSLVVNKFMMPLPYTVSDPPLSLQMNSITLSNNKYFVTSNYNFNISSSASTTITLTKGSRIGLIIDFPDAYSSIWQQIAVPSQLNITINGVTYITSNITLTNGFIFAQFSQNTFTSQLAFTNFQISFVFRNPKKDIDCNAATVFIISLFDFKGNNIFAQTNANNIQCPTFSNRLYDINVTGNTKISAGSSSVFIISLEQPASYLAITPSCVTSAISFTPSVIYFQNFSSTTQNFTINAASGLNGSYNITFTKVQQDYTFYNDIMFTTLNVNQPTSQYSITVNEFNLKSIGNPIVVNISLEVKNPSSFSLLYTSDCNDNYVFYPAGRVQIQQGTQFASFQITYTGTKVPPSCSINYTISSLTNNNYQLTNSVMYLSSYLSFDKTTTTPIMFLQLSNSQKKSAYIGYKILNQESDQKEAQAHIPELYKLKTTQLGSNSAVFLATTSDWGNIYYAVMELGVSQNSIRQASIYGKNLSSAVSYGNIQTTGSTTGVNIISNFTVTGLSSQVNYLIAAYLNSTIGVSSIYFLNFTTAKASNGASIRLSFNASLSNYTYFIISFSNVLRIKSSRINIISFPPSNLTSTHQNSVMNNRTYVYEVAIGPDQNDDSIKPIYLLNNFAVSQTLRLMLNQFVPSFIISIQPTIKQIIPSIPRKRKEAQLVTVSHQTITINVAFWQKVYVYAVIVAAPTNPILSSQIVKGVDAANNVVPTQHFSGQVLTDEDGQANITFTLLSDNKTYTVYVTAECVLSYQPKLQLKDSDVLTATSKTLVNLNLAKNQQIASKILESVNSKLAEAVKTQIDQTSQKDAIHQVNRNRKIRIDN